jgi:hypothetical protein
MKEQLITFETAKLAKEKGFNELCTFCYDLESNKNIAKTNYRNSESRVGNLSAPTQSLLQKYLREKYGIKVYCVPNNHDINRWHVYVDRKPIFNDFNYEKVLEKGLYKALKLI